MIVTAPAAFRYTYEADPDRHHRVAALLTGEPAEGADALPDALTALMRDVGAPMGIGELATARTTSRRSSRGRSSSSGCW